MPKGLQIVSGFVTAPSTTLTSWTLAAGDSLAVRNCPDNIEIRLMNFWGRNQVAGQIVVRSALLHDNVVGMTSNVPANNVFPALHQGVGQLLKAQDLLIVQQSGSAVGGQIESGSLMLYYADLPGAAARLATWQMIQGNIESFMMVQSNITPGAGGGYSGGQAINANVDQWKANRDYALLGYMTSAQCTSIGWTGPDTSNLRVGGPGQQTNRKMTANWFYEYSWVTGYPLIPIINSANKAATTIDVVQDQAAGAVVVNSIFALLRSNPGV